jgi:hypothetical protein
MGKEGLTPTFRGVPSKKEYRIMENPNQESTANHPEAGAAQEAKKALFVLTVNCATGVVTKTAVAAMRDAISAYKAVLAQARQNRAFVEFDTFNWASTIKARGGVIHMVTITNGEKVLGRAAGASLAQRRAEERASAPQVLQVQLA